MAGPWIGELLTWAGLHGIPKAVYKTGKTALTGSLGARMALGAGIGAAYQTFAGSENNINARLSNIGGAAFAGALAGAGLWAAPSIARQAAKIAPRFMSGRALPLAAKTASLGMKAGAYGISHPLVATADIAGGLLTAAVLDIDGGYGASPTMKGLGVRTNYDQQAIAIEQMSSGMLSMGEMGNAPQMSQRRFQNSTAGLVQGLNRGRHG
jgi:hypothetical protein